MKCILAIFLLVLSQGVLASDWKLLIDGEAFDFYVDKSSISNTGENKKVWVMYIYEKNQKTKSKKTYNSIKALWQFNCNEKTIAMMQQISYLGDDVVVGHSVKKYALDFSDIVPDSIAETASGTACATIQRQ